MTLKEMADRMFELDSQLTHASANWNHNLACFMRTLARTMDKRPERVTCVLSKFHPGTWLREGQTALQELRQLDNDLVDDLVVWLETDHLDRHR